MATSLPSKLRPRLSSATTEEKLWLRVQSFLSLKSANTARTYASVVTEWCEFLGAPPGSADAARLMLSADDLHAIAYRKWLERRPGERPRAGSSSSSSSKALASEVKKAPKRDGFQSTLANATITKKFAALRRIYRVLIASDLGIAQNPFDSDKVPPPSAKSGQKRPTEMVQFELVQQIINLPERSTPKGLRDHAILSVLFGGGLRRSEVVNLRLADLKKTSQGTTFLHLRSTKARKDADQALPVWAADAVWALYNYRLQKGAAPADYLFVSFTGKGGNVETRDQISDHGIYKIFKHYCKLAGAGEFLTPHSARATAITKLLSDGISHREVQEFSRHSSVQMVEVYDKRRIGVDENPGKKLGF